MAYRTTTKRETRKNFGGNCLLCYIVCAKSRPLSYSEQLRK